MIGSPPGNFRRQPEPHGAKANDPVVLRLTASPRVVRLAPHKAAKLGLIVLATDWIDWSWWIGITLASPLGLLVLLNIESVAEFLEITDADAGGFDGGDGGGGNGGD